MPPLVPRVNAPASQIEYTTLDQSTLAYLLSGQLFVDFWNTVFAPFFADETSLAGRMFHFFVETIFPLLKSAVFIVSVLAAAGIVYSMWKLRAIRLREAETWGLTRATALGGGAIRNPRWEHVLDLAASDSPGNWRLAVLEADIMLDELTQTLGLPGDTLGDRMKQVEKSDFTTLDNAWEAHKVRNRIAHGGSDFILTKREVTRIIDLYRSVFEEFQIL